MLVIEQILTVRRENRNFFRFNALVWWGTDPLLTRRVGCAILLIIVNDLLIQSCEAGKGIGVICGG